MEGKQRATVLVVDDEPGLCELLTIMLSEQGFQVYSSTNGVEALDMLSRGAMDVVISDLKMPRLNGFELLRQVNKGFPNVAFIMMTGTDDLSSGIEAMRENAADYLLKPLCSEIVVASVYRAIEKKRLDLELDRYRHELEEMVVQRTKELEIALKRIERTYDETVEALGQALDLRDNETAGHTRRVTWYATEIGKAMNCSKQQLRELALGAYLHDIGKIGIPDSVLLKPGKLDPNERKIMESHIRIGYQLVCGISFLTPAAQIVLAHHERYDGTGYPQGLIGEEIPLGARIFAVADTLDAMTSDRPYRKALSFATARDEIRQEAGRQFDPNAVRAFLGIPESVWSAIRTDVGRWHLLKLSPCIPISRPLGMQIGNP